MSGGASYRVMSTARSCNTERSALSRAARCSLSWRASLLGGAMNRRGAGSAFAIGGIIITDCGAADGPRLMLACCSGCVRDPPAAGTNGWRAACCRRCCARCAASASACAFAASAAPPSSSSKSSAREARARAT